MTSTAISAQGSTLQVSGSTGGAKTVSAVAVGFPTILTSAGHNLLNGDVLTLAGFSGADAALLNGQQVVIRNRTANTFAIDIDTTGKTITTGSATATPQQWQVVGNFKSYNGFDGKASDIDITNLGSAAREFLMGVPDSGAFTFEIDQDNTDAGQLKLYLAYTGQQLKQFKLTLPNGNTCTWFAYVVTWPSSGGVNQTVKRTIQLLISGAFTWA